MEKLIKTNKLYTPDYREGYHILIADDQIKDIALKISGVKKIIDLSDYTVLPGLIDLHVHGAIGNDTMDATDEALNAIAVYKAAQGVTSFLPATVTAPLARLKKAVANVAKAIERGTAGARILGSYLEGPYISAEQKGAHPEKNIRAINREEIEEIIDCGQGKIKIVALAPELENSIPLIKFLHGQGIKIALAHTNATYQEASRAINAGAEIAVHTFNGMRGFHHREPGMLGAVLNNDQIQAELIADLIHVSIPAIQVLLRCRDIDAICLVTDAMMAAGLADGDYRLGELTVKVVDGVARISNGSLAGSTLRLIDAVKNMTTKVGVGLSSAVKMATINPARTLALDQRLGSIEKGKQADLIAIDQHFQVVFTMIDGKIVYDQLGSHPK